MKLPDRLSTNKEFYPAMGVVGLGTDDFGNICIYEGYDGCFEYSNFTTKEKLEVAEIMISLWNKYKETLEAKNGCE